jgi:DNA helicase-2/ATP-dependent DNA helicase PcrA
MEYDTPSRFIKDIDPQLLRVEGESNRAVGYEVRGVKSAFEGGNRSWMQNPRPVATQFRADPKPRAVAPRREERPADPFSPAFRQQLAQASGSQQLAQASGARYRKVPSSASATAATGVGTLREGNMIEHQRFGIGTVVRVEGSGENEKATVNFTNLGQKQLLLKFAKYKIIQ